MANTGFVHAARVMNGVSASLERRVLIWLAKRMPDWVSADHLTALGLLGMVGAGACYWLAGTYRLALLGVIVCLAINWFGDSLDGTVARVRHQERPRYGFYVDHVLDMLGSFCLIGGLALSGFMTPLVGLGLMVAYLMLTTEVYLATYCLASFEMSYFKMGPTELRIVLIIGTIVLYIDPQASAFGERFRLFDVGAVIGICGMAVALLAAAARHTMQLYRAEPLVRRQPADSGKAGQ